MKQSSKSSASVFAKIIAISIAFSFATPSYAAVDENIPTKLTCQKPIKLSGPGNRLRSLAELTAIIEWSKKVSIKHDADHAHWHNATTKSLRCKKARRSHYYVCDISASPCINEPDIPEDQKPTVDQKDQKEPDKPKKQDKKAS